MSIYQWNADIELDDRKYELMLIVDGGMETGAAISAGIARSLGPIMEALKEWPSDGSKNFGFYKMAVPTFNGDIRDYSKWKSEVEDHVADMTKSSIKHLHQKRHISSLKKQKAQTETQQ